MFSFLTSECRYKVKTDRLWVMTWLLSPSEWNFGIEIFRTFLVPCTNNQSLWYRRFEGEDIRQKVIRRCCPRYTPRHPRQILRVLFSSGVPSESEFRRGLSKVKKFQRVVQKVCFVCVSSNHLRHFEALFSAFERRTAERSRNEDRSFLSVQSAFLFELRINSVAMFWLETSLCSLCARCQ